MNINRESRNIAFLGFGFMMIYTSVLTSRASHDHMIVIYNISYIVELMSFKLITWLILE